MTVLEQEFNVLKIIENKPHISQRQLAKSLGLSLGKAHYVLKALIGKGLVKVHNFQHSNNKTKYIYVLTPKGISERAQMTRAFLKQKHREYEKLKQEIASLEEDLNHAII